MQGMPSICQSITQPKKRLKLNAYTPKNLNIKKGCKVFDSPGLLEILFGNHAAWSMEGYITKNCAGINTWSKEKVATAWVFLWWFHMNCEILANQK